MAHLKIDRLEIRLKGISPERARALMAGLDRQLLEDLVANRHGLLKENRPNPIDRIDAGNLQTSKTTSTADLRRQIAQRVVKSIGIKE